MDKEKVMSKVFERVATVSVFEDPVIHKMVVQNSMKSCLKGIADDEEIEAFVDKRFKDFARISSNVKYDAPSVASSEQVRKQTMDRIFEQVDTSIEMGDLELQKAVVKNSMQSVLKGTVPEAEIDAYIDGKFAEFKAEQSDSKYDAPSVVKPRDKASILDHAYTAARNNMGVAAFGRDEALYVIKLIMKEYTQKEHLEISDQEITDYLTMHLKEEEQALAFYGVDTKLYRF